VSVVLAAATSALIAPVRACPADTTTRYDSGFNVGIGMGLSFFRRVAFTYGLDIRVGHGPAIAVARIEGHGMSYVRYVAGLKLFHPGTGAQLEAGGAMNSGYSDGSIDRAWGLHLAAGRWNPVAEGVAQGTIPLVGDRENYDVGVAAFFAVPGNWYYSIGCNAG
jgi:hypothetical protein